MTPVLAMTFFGVTRALAFAVLVLLLALAARRWMAGRRDPVDAGPVAIAAGASLLVAAGLALSVVHGVSAAGWLVVLLALDVALLAPRESRQRARRALPAAVAVLAAVLAIGAVALSHANAQRHERDVHFTQLWLVPHGTQADSSASVGVRNLEGRARAYHVVVTGMRHTFLDRTVQLSNGAAWTASVRLPVTDSPEQVTAQAFLPGRTAAYRTATVWTQAVP